jgi:hypothetical protein
MKFQAVTALAAFAAGVVADKITYDGWKVFSVETGTDNKAILANLELLNTVIEDDHGDADKLLVAVAPEDLDAFAKLGYESVLVEEDLGADLAEESNFKEYSRVSTYFTAVPSRE